MDLSGKVAIVTGGALGIGYAISERLAEAGAKVLIADINSEKSSEAVTKITERGWIASSAVVDVSNEMQVESMVAKAVSEFGSVDILVNNAGIYPNILVLHAEKEDFEKLLQVNLVGAFSCAKAVAAQMTAQGRGGSPRWSSGAAGKIINITSIDAIHPSSAGLAFYDASKHGLWGFTKNLALELAPHKIWVNALAPGGVATPGTNFGKSDSPEGQKFMDAFIEKIPMHRMADADEIGKAVLFLASDLSSYMTGAQLVVDGGALLA